LFFLDLSLTRKSFFLEHLENFSPGNLRAVLLGFLYFWRKGLIRESFLLFLSSIYLKFHTLLFLPVFWFTKGKFSWKKMLVTSGVSGLSFFVFLKIFQWNLAGFLENFFFLSSQCIYSCSPLVILNKFLFRSSFKLGMTLSFFLACLFVFLSFFDNGKLSSYVHFLVFSGSCFSWYHLADSLVFGFNYPHRVVDRR